MTRDPIAAGTCVALGATDRRLEAYPNREISLGSLKVSRALPVKDRRLIGPWCFLDRYGPLTFSAGRPMDVAPHPHTGLQTVTWLLEGEVVHDDSLQIESIVRPGGANVMTAGRGIAHAERTPAENSGQLNGLQLWVALPEADRDAEPAFQHIVEVPICDLGGGFAEVFAGTVGNVSSPARHFSEIVGADVHIHPGSTASVPLVSRYEHAVLVLSGDCQLDGRRLEERLLYYLGVERSESTFTSRDSARVLLVGGPPFPEQILMWWNFVARTPDEIVAARADWEAHRRFGEVLGYNGPRLDAPSLGRLARPNPLS